ncbi:hypothetical protein AMJ85_06405 [candidate division BRC1 bacterium SM23_51]|nr:MAG: hypothetical protein AMJ85_06405 [candidate division BRC1 bacterium SM23_51]
MIRLSIILHPSRLILLVAIPMAAAQRPAYCQEATTFPLRPPAEPERVERLRSHGLSPVPAVLVHFLEHGFAPSTRLADLPPVPALKSQIVIDAIVESARQRVLQAAPTLANMVRGLPSEGIRSIVRWDIEQQRASEREQFEANIMRTLRLNAIVALGLIGDTNYNYELATVLEREKDPELKIATALALATVGSRAGLSDLVREARRANRTTSVAAAHALNFITGLDYGPAADDPVTRRRAAAKRWKTWWRHYGKIFRPERDQVLARRLTPPIQPNPRDPRTVRDLADRIAYPEDPRWTVDAYDARERLRLMGPAALEGLERIIADKSENLRIRREAIILYSRMATTAYSGQSPATGQPRRAYRAIRRLRWDRNPEIREVARECLRRFRARR